MFDYFHIKINRISLELKKKYFDVFSLLIGKVMHWILTVMLVGGDVKREEILEVVCRTLKVPKPRSR